MTFRTDAGTLSQEETRTDAAGKAHTKWTLGDTPGSYDVVATWSGESVTFQAQALENEPASLVLNEHALSLEAIGAEDSLRILSVSDARGQPCSWTPKDVVWTTRDTAIATVSGGDVRAVNTGVTWAVASIGGAADSARVMVSQVVETIGISSETDTIPVGTVLQLEARALDANQNPTPATIRWSSENPSVATVDSLGVVTGVTVGSTNVIASASGHSATQLVTVIAEPRLLAHSDTLTGGIVGQPLGGPIAIQALDGAGRPISGVPVVFFAESGSGSVAPSQVKTDTSGMAEATWTLGSVPGAMVAHAQAGALDGDVQFHAMATAAPVSVLELTPSSLLLTYLGEESQVAVARAEDRFGNPVDQPSVTWTVRSPIVATLTGIPDCTRPGP